MDLSIRSKFNKEFMVYMKDSIKKELLKKIRLFNSSFLYYDKEINLIDCVNSISLSKERLYFKMNKEIAFLVLNNGQLFWIDIIKKFRNNQNYHYMIWNSNKNKRRKS